MWKCRGKFVGEKCEHFFRPNVCIGFRVSSTFGQSDGACPTHRRQWADFLAALTALPRRYDKTARTETRCHLLLKLRQVTTQTSASRGYVFFGSTGKCCTKVLQIVSRCADMTHRGVLQTWKDTDHRRCKNVWLEILHSTSENCISTSLVPDTPHRTFRQSLFS